MNDIESNKGKIVNLVKYFREIVKSNTCFINMNSFFSEWQDILNDANVNCYTIPPSDKQIFTKELIFNSTTIQLNFDCGRIEKLAKGHLKVESFSLSQFSMAPDINDIGKIIFHKVEKDCFTNINKDPIIIIPISINPNYFGFVIDGNHRVNASLRLSSNEISAYLCNELISCIGLLTSFERALYLFVQDISQILSSPPMPGNLFRSKRIESIKAMTPK